MIQDNENNKVQFCRELDNIVYNVILSSNELLSSIEKLLSLYPPKTQEEVEEFYSLKFDLPNSERLLCDFCIIKIPDDDGKFYDSVIKLKGKSIETVNYIICANVIINDIITMCVKPEEHDVLIYLYFTMLKSISNGIRYMKNELYEFYNEISQEWPELLIFDEDTYEEEAVLPGDVEGFILLKNELIKALIQYSKENKSELISDFFVAIQNYLEKFERGVEPDKEFVFDFNLVRGHFENMDMDFHFESNVIHVSSGGGVYNADVGGDSYTNWMYSIWINGREDTKFNYDFSRAIDLVCSGAELSIYSPEEYFFKEYD